MNWWVVPLVALVSMALSLPLSLYLIHRMDKDQKRRTAEVVAETDRLRHLSKEWQSIQDTLRKLNDAQTRMWR